MRYLLIVITFFMGFSSLPAWAMDCYAEHEGGNTVVIGYVPRISIPSDGKKGDKIWQSSEYFMNVFCNNALPDPSPGEEYPSAWANIMMLLASGEPRQPGGCKLKTAPVRPVVAARPAEYVCSEDLFY